MNGMIRSDPDFPWLEAGQWFRFPAPAQAGSSLVAVGGNLSPGMLLSAYLSGIFPWFSEEDPLLWQSPDPRFVIFPDSFHIPDRLSRTMRKKQFEYRVDTVFEQVIRSCAMVPRPEQDGTWITDDMIDAYVQLHRLGYAHSVESWQDGQLVGGFYGIHLGALFCGESMFAHVPDASKAAFACFGSYFFTCMGGKIIDSQVYTDHIARFGGRNISRNAYRRTLASLFADGEFPPGETWNPDMLIQAE